MIPEVGKTYKLRNGVDVSIISHDKTNNTYETDISYLYYSAHGTCISHPSSKYDLIVELEDIGKEEITILNFVKWLTESRHKYDTILVIDSEYVKEYLKSKELIK